MDGRKPADPLAYANAAVTHIAGDARIVIGGRDGRAHVYDLSGGEKFRVPLLDGSDSGAATLSSGVVVLSDTSGHLYGIDAAAGKVLWRFALSSPVTGTPVVVEKDVLVQTTDNRIYRINTLGQKMWSFTGQPGGLGLYLNASPLVRNGRVYALLTNGDAIALNAENGDLIWRKQLLLNTDAAHLSDIKAPQAAPVWMSELSFDGGVARNLVLFSFYQGDVFALDSDDGATLLTHQLSLKTEPLLKAGNMYIANTSGSLQAMEQASGNVLWKLALSKAELVGPVMWGDSFWLADNQGHIFRVSQNGHIQGQSSVAGAIDRKPVVTDAGVLFHTSLGGLYLMH